MGAHGHPRADHLELGRGLGQQKMKYPMGLFFSAQPDPPGALVDTYTVLFLSTKTIVG